MIYIDRGNDRTAYRTIYYMRKFYPDPSMEFRVVGTMNGDEEVLTQIQDVFKDFHSHRNWYKSTDFVRKSIENLVN